MNNFVLELTHKGSGCFLIFQSQRGRDAYADSSHPGYSSLNDIFYRNCGILLIRESDPSAMRENIRNTTINHRA